MFWSGRVSTESASKASITGGKRLTTTRIAANRNRTYVYAMAIAMRQFGSTEIVASFENLLNVRQTAYDRLVRPAPIVGGRWTTDVWAPLEGFIANVAVRYRWPRAK